MGNTERATTDADTQAQVATLTRELEAVKADNASLRDALDDYGQHTSLCQVWQSSARRCTCGLDAVQAAPHPGAAVLRVVAAARALPNDWHWSNDDAGERLRVALAALNGGATDTQEGAG